MSSSKSKSRNCVLCDGYLIYETRPDTFTYKQYKKTIQLEGEWCIKCGEGFLTGDPLVKSDLELIAFRDSVDSGSYLIEALENQVKTAFPNAKTELDRPDAPTQVWWLNIYLDDFLVSVEWRPEQGFGISAAPIHVADQEWGYGEGPDEVFTSFDLALERIKNLLRILI